MRRILGAAMIAMVISAPLAAQEVDPLAFYDGELMKVQFEQFGGLQIQYQSMAESIGSVRRSPIADELERFPESQVHFESYVNKRAGGIMLVIAGTTAIALSPLVLLGAETAEEFSRKLTNFTLLYSGGLVGGLLGQMTLNGSTDSLVTSVNTYNRARVQEAFE